MQTQTTDQLRNRLDQLRALRDEIRVRLHLGGLDAKTAFDKLSPRVDEFERQLARGSDVAVEEMTRALDGVRASLQELHTKLASKSGR
jgi:hypothetical protein